MRGRDAVIDLFLAGRCAGCGSPGVSACPDCRRDLELQAPWLLPMRSPIVSAHVYEDPVSGMIVAYKERGDWTLAGVLGHRLAVAVAALLAARARFCRNGGNAELLEPIEAVEKRGRSDHVLMVPIPSRRSAVRERGLDTTRKVAQVAARHITRSLGINATVAPGLRFIRDVRDQAGLDVVSRARNLAGSLGVRRIPGGAQVVIVDDVCTTGATLTEAMRAADAAGWDVLGGTVVAAARLRSAHSPQSGVRH